MYVKSCDSYMSYQRSVGDEGIAAAADRIACVDLQDDATLLV